MDAARPPFSARERCTYHSYFDPQYRALISMANSLSRGGSVELKRRSSPSFWTRSASSGLRRRTPKEPRTLPRGPPAMASCTCFWASVIRSFGKSGKRSVDMSDLLWQEQYHTPRGSAPVIWYAAPFPFIGGVHGAARHSISGNPRLLSRRRGPFGGSWSDLGSGQATLRR